MDKIILKNLCFYGYHGVLREEKTLGQKFFLDVELYLDLSEASKNDDLNATVNYAEVYHLIQELFKNDQYHLIEAVAEEICRRIFQFFTRVQDICVVVRKPEAPVPGSYDYFGVEIRRKRNA
ncbi:MAG: dihydroneopterin aldolase [Eubacteriales bacterium]